MRCVILGGGGFIGSNLARRLVADGHDVVCFGTDLPEYRKVEGARYVRADMRYPEQARAAVAGADWVFHLAADMGGVGYFHSDADFNAALANGRITSNVLAACVAAETPRLFYASSACAYPIEYQMAVGRPPRLPEPWVGVGTPDALYGAEKLHGLRLCSKVPGARVGILHTVYGPLQDWEGRRCKFPAAVAVKALRAQETGTLELWGDGMQMRSYLYIDDAVERIVRVMEADDYDGPVNIGSEGAVSCLDVARLCLELAGVPGATITLNPAEPSGVMARDCDNSEFVRRYGIVHDHTLLEGFLRFMDWIDGQRKVAT